MDTTTIPSTEEFIEQVRAAATQEPNSVDFFVLVVIGVVFAAALAWGAWSAWRSNRTA